MFGEYKYSVWAMSLKIFLLYFVSLFINVLMIFGLLSIFEESIAWHWVLQTIALVVHFGIIYMFVAVDGRRDILVDSANEKRSDRSSDYMYKKKYDTRKGFLAGVISQAPFILLFIVWIVLGKQHGGLEIIASAYMIPYFEIRELIGINIFSALLFVGLITAFSGLAYLTAKTYRNKVLTIIKRNEEKAKRKGIIKHTDMK